MKKVLVVDDEADLRSDLLIILKFEEYEVFAADNGCDALRLARKLAPDVILSDIQMPVLDGFQMIQVLRRNPNTAAIPAIFLSARHESASIQRGLQLGAVEHLTKPFYVDDFLATVQRHIRN